LGMAVGGFGGTGGGGFSTESPLPLSVFAFFAGGGPIALASALAAAEGGVVAGAARNGRRGLNGSLAVGAAAPLFEGVRGAAGLPCGNLGSPNGIPGPFPPTVGEVGGQIVFANALPAGLAELVPLWLGGLGCGCAGTGRPPGAWLLRLGGLVRGCAGTGRPPGAWCLRSVAIREFTCWLEFCCICCTSALTFSLAIALCWLRSWANRSRTATAGLVTGITARGMSFGLVAGMLLVAGVKWFGLYHLVPSHLRAQPDHNNT
jgi:hypothetical protein